MKRLVISCLSAAIVFGALVTARAAEDGLARRQVRSIQLGLDNADQIRTFRVRGDATIGGALTAGSFTAGSQSIQTNLTVTGSETVGGNVTITGVETNRGLRVNGSANVTNALTVGGSASLADTSISDTTPTFAATQLVFTAASGPTPTNSPSGSLNLIVNGTNWVVELIRPNGS